MATVNKNFVVKNGLVVQGSTATINGKDILTKDVADSYILNLVGGATLVKSVDNTVFTVDANGKLTVNSNVFDAYGSAATAETNAKNYADSAISSALVTFGSQTSTDIQDAITTAENYTDSAISGLSTVYDQRGAAYTAETNAKNYADSLASNYDAAGAAATAETNAKSYAKNYADGLASNYDAAGAAATAETNAKSYADGLASNYDAAGAAATAETNAKSYADGLASNYDPAGSATTALNSAKSYTDTAVSNVVGLAPAALDTLQELAAAFNNSPDTLTNLITTVGTKQDALTAGDGIYIDNTNTITARHQSGGGLKFVGAEAAIDRSTVDHWYDANGAAATAESNANSYTDSAISSGLNGYVTETGTETLTNKTLTDPKISGQIELLDSNNTFVAYITSNNDSLVIDTDSQDIVLNPENARAYIGSANSGNEIATEGYVNSAISTGDQNAEPTYKGVKLGYYTELVSGWNSTSNGSAFSPLQWNTATWGTAKLTVHVRSGIHTQASEILVARDSSNNLHITEYAIVSTNGSLAEVSVAINGSNTELVVTPTAGHDLTEAIASGSVIAWAD